MFWFWLLLFGAIIGAISGLLGIGGGVLLIPGLVLLFGFTQTEAQGTSLAVLIPPIGIFAAVVYYQHGFVRLPIVGLIAVGFMVGAYFGARLVPHVPPTYLRVAFGVLMLYLGFVFVLNPNVGRAGVALPAGLAATITTVLAYVFRRRARSKTMLPPPSSVHEYHI